MGESVGEHTFVRHPTALRAGPDDSAEQVSEALPGEPLLTLETRQGWAHVRTAYDYPGWLREDALGGEADPGWLEPQVHEPLEYAKTLLGAPYLWGGMSERGIDCSGLVHVSFRATGRLVPRDADEQEAAGAEVDEPRAGDLISYGDEEAVDHIAFWVGDGRILHSTSRDDADGVIEEQEPEDLRARRRRVFRL
jgi:cell wall-associated NlpC family hydrolase